MAKRKPIATPGDTADIPEQGSDLAFQIQTEFDSMSKSNQKIARFIMAHQKQIATMSITHLAEKVGTSTSTITRFCQTLGYAGFPQFKFNFESSTMTSISARQELAQGDSVPVIKEKLHILYQRYTDQTIRQLNNDDLEKVADMVVKADKTFFFGQFANAATARLGEALFLQVGIPAFAYTDISLASVAATQLKHNDLAIGLSSSGAAKTPVDGLRVARSCGATTVGITGFSNSPLAEQSDIVFCYNLGLEDVRLVHIDRLCETIILGIIQNCVITKNYGMIAKSMKMSRDAFMSVRYP